MWSDTIADLLTRIRNALRNGTKELRVPRSRMALNICRVLKAEGYINDVDEIDDGRFGQVRIQLKYGPKGEKVISHLKRESTAGCRRYVGVDKLPRVLNGLGIAIISTPRGVMSDRQCRKQRVGGELICTVY